MPLPPVLVHGDLRVDPASRVASRDGQRLALSPKEFAVLEYLLAAQGRVVSAEELLERVWDEDADPFTTAVKVRPCAGCAQSSATRPSSRPSPRRLPDLRTLMPELRHPGPARAFRRPTLRARMALLYGTVICASGVALLVVTQLLAPGLLLHGVQKAGGPGQPGAVTARPPTRIPLTVGPSAFWSIVVAFAIMAVLSVAAGWLIAGRFVRPLRAIITTARDISASNLHRRLGLRGRSDEFTELGGTLDGLFARLEASFQAQRPSSPTPPTNCGPRSPPGGRCSRSPSPIPSPPWRRCGQPARNWSSWAISRSA